MGNNQCHYSNNYHQGDNGRNHRRNAKRNAEFGAGTPLERFIGRKANRCEGNLKRKAQKYFGAYDNENNQAHENPRPKQGVLVAIVPQKQLPNYSQSQLQPHAYIQPQPQLQPQVQPRLQSQSQYQHQPRPHQPIFREENKIPPNLRGLYGDTDDGEKEITAVCKFCSDDIIPEYYSDHMKYCMLNPQNKTVPCDFCGERFDLKTINSHKLACDSNLENIRFKCEFCNEQISLASHNYHLSGCAKNPRNMALSKTRNQNLADSQINQVPECAICLIEMKDPKKIRFLGCAHKFHQECIEDWSQKSKTCPVCVTEFQ